ncbi:MAG: prolyl oligopeptidase family serine peptidase [Muribaculaceae bacterium]|nr:prolyl oligopeptidase family serine peptidase [Muribaculaceae bacterium]
MKHANITLAASLLLCGASLFSLDAKRPLNHDDFDAWQSVKADAISRNGNWSAYRIVPQEGDATLYLRNNRKGSVITIDRGDQPSFTADGKWAIAKLKPFYADTRKAKIDKKKDFDLPQDTLIIVDLSNGRIEKIPNVINYKVGERGGNFIAYQSCDTLHIKPKDLKNKKAGKPLIIRSLTTPAQKSVKWVSEYGFSKDGHRLALKITPPEKDTLSTPGVAIVNLPDTSMTLIDRDRKFYSLPQFNDNASMLAYTASDDSIDSGTRHARLYLVELSRTPMLDPNPREFDISFLTLEPINLQPPHSDDPEIQARLEKERAEEIRKSAGDTLRINQYSQPKFSKSGRFLYVDVAPVIAPNDTTIVDFEQAALDIWRWNAPYTPPQEKANLDKLRKKGLPVVIDLDNDCNYHLLTKNMLATVEPPFNLDAEWALIHDPSEKMISKQWDYFAREDLKMVNVATGQTKAIGPVSHEAVLSPDGRFTVWFTDRQYYAYDVKTGKTICLSESIEEPLWNIDDDHPMPSEAYGIAGWGEGDNRVLVYDKYDIWSLDLTGESEPFNLTSGEGRKNNLKIRYNRLDPEFRTLKKGETMVAGLFDYATKKFGIATLPYSGSPVKPSIKILDEYRISQFKKAKDADVYMWEKANFSTMPDLYTSNSTDFAHGKRLTHSNPQMKDISWGTAQLVKWYAYDGSPAEGVLYLPEDFDPNGSYPLLSVFYETGSEELYTHYTMQPSWSWVNYPFYVSRGYAVFVPDIHYKTAGVPGECCYNYVCSGVEEMCRRYPAFDKKRLGIDGQSWGGYQTAYLVTRTNMFACAGSGAPVANMTSAFGGIRWGSGDSRMAQYEMGQSRIGRNLWDAPELYVANSPVFHADRVETPLLIMHNDADGAVPWYQGIELFMALRRLEKPVWMLQYNGEAHNIKARKNRKDITKRLQQFFDHYLKGDPMPRWMREGISPLRKGQDLGF